MAVVLLELGNHVWPRRFVYGLKTAGFTIFQIVLTKLIKGGDLGDSVGEYCRCYERRNYEFGLQYI